MSTVSHVMSTVSHVDVTRYTYDSLRDTVLGATLLHTNIHIYTYICIHLYVCVSRRAWAGYDYQAPQNYKSLLQNFLSCVGRALLQKRPVILRRLLIVGTAQLRSACTRVCKTSSVLLAHMCDTTVSFAKELYERDDILQKRRTI